MKLQNETMKIKDITQCSFQNWYGKFEKVTIESLILPIPPETLSYLQENGTLVIPEGSYGNIPEADETWEDGTKDSTGAVAIAPNLDKFNEEIRKAIKKLGGTVFPKLNWSSPKDASWISFNKSLKCSNPGDVYLLLKSSDFVSHDLTCPFKDCSDVSQEEEEKVDYCLVLRKWIEMNPSDEFRCFVKNRELVGICQRDISQYYSSIHKEKDCIVDDIILFWEENVRNYFPSFSYVFDVHRPNDSQVTLIDFGPFGSTTDELLFSWEELLSPVNYHVLTDDLGKDSNILIENALEEERDPEFRYIASETGVQPSPYSRYGLPIDIVDLSTGADPSKLVDFLQMKIQTGDESNSEDESEVEQEDSFDISSHED